MKATRLVLIIGLLLSGGCVEQRVVDIDSENPVFSISRLGVKFGNRFVDPSEAVEALEDAGIPKQQTIYIHIDSDALDMRVPSHLMGVLAKAGYTRPMIVTKRHSESYKVDRKRR